LWIFWPSPLFAASVLFHRRTRDVRDCVRAGRLAQDKEEADEVVKIILSGLTPARPVK